MEGTWEVATAGASGKFTAACIGALPDAASRASAQREYNTAVQMARPAASQAFASRSLRHAPLPPRVNPGSPNSLR